MDCSNNAVDRDGNDYSRPNSKGAIALGELLSGGAGNRHGALTVLDASCNNFQDSVNYLVRGVDAAAAAGETRRVLIGGNNIPQWAERWLGEREQTGWVAAR